MRHKFLLLLLVLVTAAVLISCNALDQVAKNQNKTQLGPETVSYTHLTLPTNREV